MEELTQYEHFAPIAAEIPILIINGLVELDNVYCVLSDEREGVKIWSKHSLTMDVAAFCI